MRREPAKSFQDLIVWTGGINAFSGGQHSGETPKLRLGKARKPRHPSRSELRPQNVHQEKRRYEAAFIAKLNDSEAALKDTASHKAAETQTWLDFAVECNYLDTETGQQLSEKYDQILGILVKVINNPQPWLLKR